MEKWISVRTGMPNEEVPCIVLQRRADAAEVYPKFCEYDGENWVDIDGEIVPGIIAWVKAPSYDTMALTAVSKLAGCFDKDTCEVPDCCYFANQLEIAALLRYLD